MPDLPFPDVLPTAREAEALFARGDDDALIRRERKTQADFAQRVALTIDGVEVTVPRATPVTDAQGNIKYGPDGLPVPPQVEVVLNWFEELKRRVPTR